MKKGPISINEVLLFWWPGTGSNRRHADFQSAALPTELPGQISGTAKHRGEFVSVNKQSEVVKL